MNKMRKSGIDVICWIYISPPLVRKPTHRSFQLIKRLNELLKQWRSRHCSLGTLNTWNCSQNSLGNRSWNPMNLRI